MPIFRKKPVQIEAHQMPAEPEREPSWLAFSDVAEWCGGRIINDAVDGRCILIHTPEGDMKARAGDWIIKGVSGEFYPCKPAIFAQTYEQVED